MCYFKTFFTTSMIVVNNFSGSTYGNFEPRWSDLESDYSSSSNTAYGKKGYRVDLLGGWKKD